MRPIEALRSYFRVDVPTLTPEELAEARILGEVLKNSGAPELLLVEKENRWGRVGEIIRAEALLSDGEGGYKLETALAYPKPRKPRIVVAVGALRIPEGFGIYVSSNDKDVFRGNARDERLPIELGRAFGTITLQMRRQGIV